MPAARRRHCCIWKKTDRERERERGSASVFGRRGRSRRTAAEGCIIKSIHSGLPNRSILIREPFSGTARREKNSPFRPSPYSRRCKFLSTPSPPPILDTEPRKRHDNFLADSGSLCGVEEKVGTRARQILRGKKNEIVNRTMPPLIKLIPSFNCLDLGELYRGRRQKFVDR